MCTTISESQTPSPDRTFSFHRRAQYSVTLADGELDRPFLNIEEADRCHIVVTRIPERTKSNGKKLETDEKTELTKKYVIHAGYRRYLAGFLREIDFVKTDRFKSHNALFRMAYLVKTLDLFALELEHTTKLLPRRFRSRVLNPLLQRQLRGLNDNEALMAKAQIPTLAAAAEFYLTLDPVGKATEEMWQRGFIYIWPVRMSFSLLHSPGEEEQYDEGLESTLALLKKRISLAATYSVSKGLYAFERRLIKSEGLERYFVDDFHLVSVHHSLSKYLDVHRLHSIQGSGLDTITKAAGPSKTREISDSPDRSSSTPPPAPSDDEPGDEKSVGRNRHGGKSGVEFRAESSDDESSDDESSDEESSDEEISGKPRNEKSKGGKGTTTEDAPEEEDAEDKDAEGEVDAVEEKDAEGEVDVVEEEDAVGGKKGTSRRGMGAIEQEDDEDRMDVAEEGEQPEGAKKGEGAGKKRKGASTTRKAAGKKRKGTGENKEDTEGAKEGEGAKKGKSAKKKGEREGTQRGEAGTEQGEGAEKKVKGAEKKVEGAEKKVEGSKEVGGTTKNAEDVVEEVGEDAVMKEVHQDLQADKDNHDAEGDIPMPSPDEA